LAVAEAARNVACAGAQPIAGTNCLNFGNPERSEIMWQFARAVEGIGVACRALDIPITGGNVSLYNETDGTGILPTPVLGVVGLIEDATKVTSRVFRSEGDSIMLLGETWDELGGSAYLKIMHGLVRGVPPRLDLVREAALLRLLVKGVSEGVIRSAHDCAEGGLAVTLAECCFDAGVGAVADLPVLETAAPGFHDISVLFGESASRVVVSVAASRVAELQALAEDAGVPASTVGRVGGDRIRVAVAGRGVLDESLAEAERLWSRAIGNYFESQRTTG
jgi:phosphoribosylformylglycinamidine synthase